jgi:hypothetical protein
MVVPTGEVVQEASKASPVIEIGIHLETWGRSIPHTLTIPLVEIELKAGFLTTGCHPPPHESQGSTDNLNRSSSRPEEISRFALDAIEQQQH